MFRYRFMLISGVLLCMCVAALMLFVPAHRTNAQMAAPNATLTNWPQFGFNAQNTRYNNKETTLSSGNVGHLTQAWSTFLSNYNTSASPIVVGGYIYTTARDAYLYKLNANTGKIVWKVNTSSISDLPTPAVANGLVYIGVYAQSGITFNAYHASNGSIAWQTPLSGDFDYSAPTVTNGVVYFGGAIGQVHALNASTGAVLWYAYTGGNYNYTPAVTNGIVYGDSYGGGVYAINPAGCTPAAACPLLWTAATSTYIFYHAEVVEANGIVYVTCTDNKLYAFNASTGKQVWTAATGAEITGAPAYATGSVYVGSTDDKFYAFNAKTGTKSWSVTENNQFGSTAAIANGVVYATNLNGGLYAFQANTGAVLLNLNTGGVPNSPMVVNATVYVSTTVTNTGGVVNAYH